MHRKTLALLSVAALGLVACEQNSSVRGTYRCERGVVLDVVFSDGQKVDVKSANGAYTLMRVERTTGVQYEGDDSIFISRGVEATFAESGHKPVRCRRN